MTSLPMSPIAGYFLEQHRCHWIVDVDDAMILSNRVVGTNSIQVVNRKHPSAQRISLGWLVEKIESVREREKEKERERKVRERKKEHTSKKISRKKTTLEKQHSGYLPSVTFG